MVWLDGEVYFLEVSLVGRFVEYFLEQSGYMMRRVVEGSTAEGGEDQDLVPEDYGNVQDCPYLVLHCKFVFRGVAAVIVQIGVAQGGNRHEVCSERLLQKRIAVILKTSEHGYIGGIGTAKVPVHGI